MEFLEARGEHQRPGDRDVYGLPQVTDTPPPEPLEVEYRRHVYSTFESRPVGAIDVAITVQRGVARTTNGQTDFTLISPSGYTFFLRQFEIHVRGPIGFSPAFGAFPPYGLEFTHTINGVPIPFNRWYITDGLSRLVRNTALLYASDDIVGVSMVQREIGFTVGEVYGWPTFISKLFTATFIGTLIPATGKPVEEDVGSDERPLLRRLTQYLRDIGRNLT